MLSSPKTAKKGNLWGIIGIVSAILACLFIQSASNILSSSIIILSGGIIGIYFGKKVKITALPQMIAVFNSLGGISAVCIAISEELSHSQSHFMNLSSLIIGAITFSGSIIAFAKLQGLLKTKPIHFSFQHSINFAITFLLIFLTFYYLNAPETTILIIITSLTLILGILLPLPVGGADMPVVISILNSFSGWATVGIGISLSSAILIIIGNIVAFGGSILAFIMMKSMNRNLSNILTGSFVNQTGSVQQNDKTARSGSPEDAAFIMENSQKIIIVPGYGMAVAQAQHSIKNMVQLLKNKYQVEVKFAIHPVAGRMPGHMNVLLAEANIDYDDVFELDDINNEFATADVAYVIGANDITNPLAKTDSSSPIYQMPILEVEKAKTVFFVKRSLNSGYSGIDNPLFYAPNTIMLYGDAKDVTDAIVKQLEQT
ncbi:MAG: NAD(P)(+) transhydrogenase (Re/Si-specific) subunit beta [Alphaproteobacteria bacterium]|nr:NAD(P)(+) transhydrogenase (Re/Si-specific) subunit beta [Alphaproteobacteria bacterium]